MKTGKYFGNGIHFKHYNLREKSQIPTQHVGQIFVERMEYNVTFLVWNSRGYFSARKTLPALWTYQFGKMLLAFVNSPVL